MPIYNNFSCPSGVTLTVGRFLALAPFQLAANGIWTWFSDPRAVYRNGATYVMAVDSAGTNWIHKYVHATAVTTSFQLSATGLEVDDHNNGSIYFLADGKIAAFYGLHNDTVFRYRVSTNAEDISAWGAEAQRGSGEGNYSYPTMFRMSVYTGGHFFLSRRWFDGGSQRHLSMRTFTTLTGSSDTISAYTDLWAITSQIPYWRTMPDGTSRLHIVVTNMHPSAGQSSLYHFYGDVNSSGVWSWYTSAGVLISATPPFNTTHATLIYDGTTTRCWVSDMVIDSTGKPRVLYMRYPGNDGSAIEYWHARWDGSAWVKNKITNDGAGLYAGEPFYHGGMCFDSMDVTRVFLSAPVSGVRQIQEWSTSDSGVTWAVVRQITSGGTAGTPLKARPYSPQNHNGSLRVLWWEGTYTTYINYNTSVKGAG